MQKVQNAVLKPEYAFEFHKGSPTSRIELPPATRMALKADLHFENPAKSFSPKLNQLLLKIDALDKADLARHKTLFKHYIYSSVPGKYGARLIVTALLADNYTCVLDRSMNYLPDENDERKSFAFMTKSAVFSHEVNQKKLKKIKDVFNRAGNESGKDVRILVLDGKYKEGIDVYDVKYCHLFDPISPADERQAIGRGLRFCGQANMKFRENVGWTLQVYKYDLELPTSITDVYDVPTTLFGDAIRSLNPGQEKADEIIRRVEELAQAAAIDAHLTAAMRNAIVGGGSDNLVDTPMSDNLVNSPSCETSKISDEELLDKYDHYKKVYTASRKKPFCRKEATRNLKHLLHLKRRQRALADLRARKPSASPEIRLPTPLPSPVAEEFSFTGIKQATGSKPRRIKREFDEYKSTKSLLLEQDCEKREDVFVVSRPRVANLSDQQAFIRHYFTPSRKFNEKPIHGLLLWHTAGSGKTCTAVATATANFEPQGYTILYITRDSLLKDVQKNLFLENVCDEINIKDYALPASEDPDAAHFDERLPKQLRPTWLVMSYETFYNLLGSIDTRASDGSILYAKTGTPGSGAFDTSAYTNLVLKSPYKERSRDILFKTLVIIDEAHKLHDPTGSSTESLLDDQMKKVSDIVHNSYAVSGTQATKLLLMTATPIKRDAADLFILINLLRTTPLPTSEPAFSQRYLVNGVPNDRITSDLKGYLSYVDLRNDKTRFAQAKIHKTIVTPIAGDKENVNWWRKFDAPVKAAITEALKRYPSLPAYDAVQTAITEIRKINEATFQALPCDKSVATCRRKFNLSNPNAEQVTAWQVALQTMKKDPEYLHMTRKPDTQIAILKECFKKYNFSKKIPKLSPIAQHHLSPKITRKVSSATDYFSPKITRKVSSATDYFSPKITRKVSSATEYFSAKGSPESIYYSAKSNL